MILATQNRPWKWGRTHLSLGVGKSVGEKEKGLEGPDSY